MRSSSIFVSVGLLSLACLVITVSPMAPLASRANAAPDAGQPDAGPTGPGSRAADPIHEGEVPAREDIAPDPIVKSGPISEPDIPQPILAEDGTVLGTFTAPPADAPPMPLNAVIRAKLAMARASIAAAEAAGTRAITLPERPVLAPEELDRIKLERLAAIAPQPLAIRPGVPSNDSNDAAPAGEEVAR
jgi:hypothetical protein